MADNTTIIFNQVNKAGKFGSIVDILNANFNIAKEAILMMRGKSAYEIWREQDGNENKTIKEFLASLKESGFETEAVPTRPSTIATIDNKTIYAVPEWSEGLNPQEDESDMWAEYIYVGDMSADYSINNWLLLAKHNGSGLSSALSDINDIKEELPNKLNVSQQSDRFYITDASGNIVFIVDSEGVHSVDFKYGAQGTSVTEAIQTAITLVRDEEARAKDVENTKLSKVIEDDKFIITDANGYIIFQVDKYGAHFPNSASGGGGSNVIDNDHIAITDNAGFIIAKIDENGIHAAQDKYSVACMVISDNYYPVATPTRDGDGNVIHADVMFATGVTGEISVTYNNGFAALVSVVYGDNEYQISVNRDIDGNVNSVYVE